jgi:hypothetical protein
MQGCCFGVTTIIIILKILGKLFPSGMFISIVKSSVQKNTVTEEQITQENFLLPMTIPNVLSCIQSQVSALVKP